MKTLFNVTEVTNMIRAGRKLLLAGDDLLLSQLPRGNWVGGTIPYFMSEKGGIDPSDLIQVGELPDFITSVRALSYGAHELQNIPSDYPDNGVSFIMIPAFSEAHRVFAERCSTFPGLFDRPLLGWVTGFHLERDARKIAKTYNGLTGESFADKAVVLSLELPENKFGRVNIINLFNQGSGDTLVFKETGFEVERCFVNGQEMSFRDYIQSRKIDTQLPLIANYSGAMINVSIMSVSDSHEKVKLYAPIFADVEYKFANPVSDYEAEFDKQVSTLSVDNPTISCNCVLNYLYAHLNGKKTGNIMGPMTFGEIAYMLLNQTVVYISFEDKV